MTSYPRPSTATSALPELSHTRTLRTPSPPSLPLPSPSLPSPPREPAFSSKFTLSTHIFSAAYPRTAPPDQLPTPPPNTGIPKKHKQLLNQTAAELLSLKQRQHNDDRGNTRVLWNCVNRYVRRDLVRSRGITLLFTQGTGFPKEIWEPTIEHLLATPSGAQIDEIWSWEGVQHGNAGLINEGALTEMFDWSDNSRDILNFLLNFLPTCPDSRPLPIHLSPIANAESRSPMGGGWSKRTFVTVGHSFGGCSVALAASTLPTLFPSLVLIDPSFSPRALLVAQCSLTTLSLLWRVETTGPHTTRPFAHSK
ncbi:hypothetical protein PLICRDRAFT_51853 [Plicaturopsis crispa FD-325 SS-3]|nr:hypothetical protein PLICRDRAFT_51853 [Plicaturopsis crispa FD-325 SS-3]